MSKEKKIEKEIVEEKIEPKNLYQKLLEVRKTVPYIKKGGQSYDYKYTKESQILGALKDEMNNQGIWIDMDMTSVNEVEVAIYVKKTKSVVIANGIRAYFEFTITNCDNPEEVIIKHQILQDSGSDVKTIGALQTYANKYFLLKFFNIPNDEIDPDKFEKTIEAAVPTDNKYISSDQMYEITKMLVELSVEKYNDLLRTLKIKDFNKIPAEHYEKTVDYIKKYINNNLEKKEK